MSAALALLSACAISPRPGSAIPVVDAKGVRSLGEGPFLLDFLAIKAGTEDRVVLEFDIGGRGRQLPKVILRIRLHNLDEDGEPGVIDVFAFAGDGVVEAKEFYAGERIARVPVRENGKARADVTSVINAALAGGEQFLGLRLSTETDDRYFLGRVVGLEDPNLRVLYGKRE